MYVCMYVCVRTYVCMYLIYRSVYLSVYTAQDLPDVNRVARKQHWQNQVSAAGYKLVLIVLTCGS